MTLLDSRVCWNDKSLARVHPRRDARTARRPQADPGLWSALHVRVSRYLPALERGLGRVDENCATQARRALDLVQARAATPLQAPLDVEVEAVLSVALGVTRRAHYFYSREEQNAALQQVDALVAAWAEHGGLDFAVKAVVEAAHWECKRAGPVTGADYFAQLVITLERQDAWHARCEAAAFHALRAAVSVAEPAQYARGRDAALEIRRRHIDALGHDFGPDRPHDPEREASKRIALYERCMLAYAFPDEPWWEEDADAALTVPGWMWLDLVAPLAASVQGERAITFVERVLLVHGGAAGPMLGYLPSFVYNVGPTADRALIALLDKDGPKEVVQGVAEALSLVETPLVATRMASLLTDKNCRAIASQYFSRVPRLAAPALLPLHLEGRGELAEAATVLLTRLARSAGDELAAAPLDDACRKALDALCAPVVEAASESLPRVLVSPPWAASKTRPRRAPVVVDDVQHPQTEETMAWRPMERDACIKASVREAYRTAQVDLAAPQHDLVGLFALDDAEARRTLESASPASWTIAPYHRNQLPALVALYDYAFLPVLLAWADTRLAEVAALLTAYASPRVAPPLARALHALRTVQRFPLRFDDPRTQPTRPLVHSWLLEHAEQAAAGLVPVAVGPLGPARDACEAALRFLAAQGREAQVRDAASACAATAAVDEILGYDPLLAFPDKLPRKPSFWKAAELPPPRLAASGHALPLSAMEHLGTMLTFSPLSPPYTGLSEVRAACEPKSLDAFSWSLFQTWLMDGAPPKEAWAMNALAHLGTDDMARRLAPLVKGWPREGAQARAVLGLDVLAQIGSDVALRVLFGIAERGRKALKERAAQRLDELARLRGLTADDLADRLVPDLDLDEDGSCTLDYGPRQFRVGFDDDGKPFAVDAHGARLADLPAPSSDDDRDRATASVDQWRQIKKDARKVLSEQTRRLEAAMVAERRWPLDEFTDNLLRHPLLVHLVRRLVWGVYTADGLAATFMARDEGLEDADERPVTLPGGCRIGLVHPLELSAAQAASWIRLLTDYKIVPPFPQLGRAVKRPKEADRDATALTHLDGRTTSVARLLGLERRGWRKGAQYRKKHSLEMVVVGYEKPVQNGAVLATLRFSPGFDLGSNEGTMSLGRVEFRASLTGRHGEAGLLHVADVSAVAFSEVMADLETLKA